MFTVNKNPSLLDLKKFGRAMLIGFGVLGAILWIGSSLRRGSGVFAWSGSGAQITALAFWALGVGLWAVSVASPAAAKPVYVGWMTVTLPIGIAMATVLLSLLFVVLLPVFALIVRMADPLRMRLHSGGTYWEDYRHYEPTVERMRRPF
ncbi:MAG: hypothetical protein HY763_02880 [Planctomycetes bacterium]|nr:hypothetical protein [Planctomycetota bacterium]